jgi:hypothetical protein
MSTYAFRQVAEVDTLVNKYAGDYKTMTKKLEAKYHDYGKHKAIEVAYLWLI